MPHLCPELDGEVVAQIAIDGQRGIDQSGQHDAPRKVMEEFPALFVVHGRAFIAQHLVFFRRRGYLAQQPDAQQQERDKHQSHEEGHPEVAYSPIDYHVLSHRLDDARGGDKADAQAGTQQLGVASAFQKRDDDAENHSQRQPVDEQEDDIVGPGHPGEEKQGCPCDTNQS